MVLSGVLAVWAVQGALGRDVTLEDDWLRVTFDSDSGALTRLEDKAADWTIERRPELGMSFRLHAPLPDRRDNFVLGEKQRAAQVSKLSDHEVCLKWENPVSEHGGVLAMTFSVTVTLTNGTLAFEGVLTNDSALPVETIDCPYLGDFNPPTRHSKMEARVRRDDRAADQLADEIYPHFENEKGYWGVFYPTKTLESGRDLFCLIQSQAPDEGLCVELNVPTLSYRLQYTFEQHPGVISSVNNLVPPSDEISGTPVHLELRTCHFIFARPHSVVKLMPVVLHSYLGNWRAGVDYYKQSRPTPTGSGSGHETDDK